MLNDSIQVRHRLTGENAATDDWGVPVGYSEWKTVAGVRFRPLNAQEQVALTDRASETWKLTAPPVPDILAIKADSQIQHNGIIYEVDGGMRPFTDASGQLFKVTVMCKRQQTQIA